MNANFIITDQAELLVHSKHEVMRALERAINDISPTNIPILLVGESGTGKKLVAQHIHRKSTRAKEPFARVICAVATAEALEVFFRKRHGDAVNGGQSVGTLFLEEISELDTSKQRHFLYMLPEPEVHSTETAITPRLISSTNRNLDQHVRSGNFRQELYYRINGACLRLPPLRERIDDLPEFVELFLAKHSAALSKPRPVLNSCHIQRLKGYSWPGNLRELENTVKRIIALGDPDIEIANLAAHVSPVQQSNPGEKKLGSLKIAARAASQQAERQLILQALEKTRWNRKRAAQELQISYKSLLYKLKQIGAEEPELT